MSSEYVSGGAMPAADPVVVTGTGWGPAEPDQVIAAQELARLRDRCAQVVVGAGSVGGALHVPEIRSAATALRDRATADDSNAAYAVAREGMSVRVTRHGVDWDAYRALDQRFEERYGRRSLTGWIVGLIIGLLCRPVGAATEGLTREEAELDRVLTGSVSIVSLVVVAGCLIGLIAAARKNRELRRWYLQEHDYLIAEFKYAEAHLAQRTARVARARREASAAYDELAGILDRAEGAPAS